MVSIISIESVAFRIETLQKNPFLYKDHPLGIIMIQRHRLDTLQTSKKPDQRSLETIGQCS